MGRGGTLTLSPPKFLFYRYKSLFVALSLKKEVTLEEPRDFEYPVSLLFISAWSCAVLRILSDCYPASARPNRFLLWWELLPGKGLGD